MKNKKENLVQILIIVMLVDKEGDVSFEKMKIIQDFAENLNLAESEIRELVEELVPYVEEKDKLTRIAIELSNNITLPTIRLAGINAINKVIELNEDDNEYQEKLLNLISNNWA